MSRKSRSSWLVFPLPLWCFAAFILPLPVAWLGRRMLQAATWPQQILDLYQLFGVIALILLMILIVLSSIHAMIQGARNARRYPASEEEHPEWGRLVRTRGSSSWSGQKLHPQLGLLFFAVDDADDHPSANALTCLSEEWPRVAEIDAEIRADPQHQKEKLRGICLGAKSGDISYFYDEDLSVSRDAQGKLYFLRL